MGNTYSIIGLNKKLVFVFLLVSVIGIMRASDPNVYPPQYQQECVWSSVCVGSAIGALCGLLDRKPNCLPFTWIGSFYARTIIIDAIHHERGSSQKTTNFAHDVACMSSWISWAIVYSRLLS